jgi:hypothetical protein
MLAVPVLAADQFCPNEGSAFIFWGSKSIGITGPVFYATLSKFRESFTKFRQIIVSRNFVMTLQLIQIRFDFALKRHAL